MSELGSILLTPGGIGDLDVAKPHLIPLIVLRLGSGCREEHAEEGDSA
jgi:hypothetical protein